MPGLISPPMDALRFDHFELRPAQRQLLADGRPLELGARALDLLCVLVEHAGQLVTKDSLLDRVWPDLVVEEANLHVQVSTLRRLLGREAIATVPGRGYQFVRPLQARPAAAPASAPAAPGLPLLHGRDAELAQAQALLESGPLLTITGAGGGGKTLLARHLMHRLQAWRPQGAAWVDLLELADADAVPAAVSAALGFERGPATVPALARALCADDRLLVLDNAEHLLEPVRVLVAALLQAAPGLRLLVTSQAPLKLPAEQRLALRGLPVPALPCSAETASRNPAVALFIERARQVDRRFRLDDGTVGDVVAIASALDGSALGLQLAASLLSLQPLAALRQRLAPAVSPGADTAPAPADNVLRAALSWSHELLDEAPRRVFRRLAAALGPLPLPVIQALAADETMDATAVADALAELVDRSLVDASPEDGDSDLGEPRYRLLEAPRALALEHLQAHGEASAVQGRMARVLGSMARRESEEQAPGERPALARIAAADVRSALRWALAHDLATAALLAPRPACHQRPAAERLAWAAQLIEGAPTLPPRAAGDAWLAAAVLVRHSDLLRRHELMLQAAARYAEADAPRDRYYALARAAEAAAVHRQPALADAPLAEARALEDPNWPAGLRAVLAEAEAAMLSAREALEPARLAWLRALELGRQRHGGSPSLSTLVCLADIELQGARFVDATAHLEEAAALARQQGQQGDRLGYILPNLAAARLMQADLAGARRVAAEAWPQARELDADAWWADHLSLLAALEGRPRSAALLLGLADAAYQRIKGGRHELETRNAERAAELAGAALGCGHLEALRAAGAEPMREAAVRHWALQLQDAPEG
jgi:predicted ATPase/DNA-binding winged helix-turn-helix (wHTH) protein